MKKTKILSREELKRFREKTNVKASHVFISQRKDKYYAILIDACLKIEIKEKLALQFL